MFGCLPDLGASCAAAYPGVVGSAESSAGSGEVVGGAVLKSVNSESWCADLGFGCAGCMLIGGDWKCGDASSLG
jgi:hypothetical protein